MLNQSLVQYLNHTIMRQASNLSYIVKDLAPNSETDLFNSTGLVVWSGASDNTIFADAKVNHAFRALHDALHLETRLDFSIEAEIELGRIQASKFSGVLADLIYCEVAGQAMYYKQNGVFVPDQVEFTKQFLKGIL